MADHQDNNEVQGQAAERENAINEILDRDDEALDNYCFAMAGESPNARVEAYQQFLAATRASQKNVRRSTDVTSDTETDGCERLDAEPKATGRLSWSTSVNQRDWQDVCSSCSARRASSQKRKKCTKEKGKNQGIAPPERAGAGAALHHRSLTAVKASNTEPRYEEVQPCSESAPNAKSAQRQERNQKSRIYLQFDAEPPDVRRSWQAHRPRDKRSTASMALWQVRSFLPETARRVRAKALRYEPKKAKGLSVLKRKHRESGEHPFSDYCRNPRYSED